MPPPGKTRWAAELLAEGDDWSSTSTPTSGSELELLVAVAEYRQVVLLLLLRVSVGVLLLAAMGENGRDFWRRGLEAADAGGCLFTGLHARVAGSERARHSRRGTRPVVVMAEAERAKSVGEEVDCKVKSVVSKWAAWVLCYYLVGLVARLQ